VYHSSNTIRVIKSKKMRWVGEIRNAREILVGNPERNRPLGIPKPR
jgi:hypothetical protein